LRPGGLAVEDIERVTGQTVIRQKASDGAIVAPGMLVSHYAPHAPMRININHVNDGDVLVTFGKRLIAGQEKAEAIFDLSPSGNLNEAATHLFDILKQADAAGGRCIAVCPIPHHGLGEAINDRLNRAAAPRS
jgi:L-threonylcarbamoyladenylate synthase